MGIDSPQSKNVSIALRFSSLTRDASRSGIEKIVLPGNLHQPGDFLFVRFNDSYYLSNRMESTAEIL